MRRSMVVIGSIFVMFLVIGLRAHTEKGMYVFSEFWNSQPDGSYTLRDRRISFDKTGNTVHARVQHGDNSFLVQLTLEDDRWLAVLEDSSELDIQRESLLLIESGGMIQGDTYELTLRGMMPELMFEGLRGEEVYPFFDEDGKEMGEMRSLVSESGKVLDFQEVWHDHPERSTEKRREVLLHEGVVISSADYDRGLFINASGEYLINPEVLFFIPWGNRLVAKNVAAGALIRMITRLPEARGNAGMALVYALLYIMGAAVFLWPQKMAFLGSRWRFQTEPELSDSGEMMERIGGILMMGCAIFLLFYPLFYR